MIPQIRSFRGNSLPMKYFVLFLDNKDHIGTRYPWWGSNRCSDVYYHRNRRWRLNRHQEHMESL